MKLLVDDLCHTMDSSVIGLLTNLARRSRKVDRSLRDRNSGHGVTRLQFAQPNNIGRAGNTVLKVLLVLGFIGAANAVVGEMLIPKVEAYLKTYCVGCHSEKSTKSDFSIDKLSAKVGFQDTPQWLEVIERINSGEMPPKDAKQRPTAEESAAAVEWLAARIKEGEAARMAARGRVSYNRLTRDEYVNSV